MKSSIALATVMPDPPEGFVQIGTVSATSQLILHVAPGLRARGLTIILDGSQTDWRWSDIPTLLPQYKDDLLYCSWVDQASGAQVRGPISSKPQSRAPVETEIAGHYWLGDDPDSIPPGKTVRSRGEVGPPSR